MARSDGADTAHTIGMPATAAFWTISKLTRPETRRIRSQRGSSRARTREPMTLSRALWRPTSSRRAMSWPSVSKSPAAWRPPVRSKAACASRRRSGRPRITVRGTTGRPFGSGSQRTATSSIDALPQMPQEAVAMKWRFSRDGGVHLPGQPDHDGVIGLGHEARVAARRRPGSRCPRGGPRSSGSRRRAPSRSRGSASSPRH